jgi:predicted nuclease with TOPRIM domain
VTTWGIVALVLAGIAVMGANMSALMPQSLLAGLHKTRIGGASLEQLRGQVADLREETQRLRRENSVLAARFALEEQQGNEVTRRVGALEVSLPRLLEALPDNAGVDLSNLTA